MGYCVLVVHGLNRLYSAVSRWGAAVLTVSMLVVLLLFSWKTVQQNEIWLSREALFRSVCMFFVVIFNVHTDLLLNVFSLKRINYSPNDKKQERFIVIYTVKFLKGQKKSTIQFVSFFI